MKKNFLFIIVILLSSFYISADDMPNIHGSNNPKNLPFSEERRMGLVGNIINSGVAEQVEKKEEKQEYTSQQNKNLLILDIPKKESRVVQVQKKNKKDIETDTEQEKKEILNGLELSFKAKKADVVQNTAPNPNRVAGFNVAQIRLGMTERDVLEEMNRNSFKLKNKLYGIPEKTALIMDGLCLDNGTYQFEQRKECIRQKAIENGHYYLKQMTFERAGEVVDVYFLSNYSDSSVYRVSWRKKGDSSLGATKKDEQNRLWRDKAFRDSLYQKYGSPDNEKALRWGLPKDIYLKASITPNNKDMEIIFENHSALSEDIRRDQKFYLDYFNRGIQPETEMPIYEFLF